jgi:hypothetical protein
MLRELSQLKRRNALWWDFSASSYLGWKTGKLLPSNGAAPQCRNSLPGHATSRVLGTITWTEDVHEIWSRNCYILLKLNLSTSLERVRPPLRSSGQSSWLLNGDVSCFLWSTNWIYICYVEKSRPPLWSSGQSSWLPNGDVLCFLWSKNWIYICYVEKSRPPLWGSGQSSWLHNGDVMCFL